MPNKSCFVGQELLVKNTNNCGALGDYDSEMQALAPRTAAKEIRLRTLAGVVGEKHQQRRH
jgi:hypothetical protein